MARRGAEPDVWPGKWDGDGPSGVLYREEQSIDRLTSPALFAVRRAGRAEKRDRSCLGLSTLVLVALAIPRSGANPTIRFAETPVWKDSGTTTECHPNVLGGRSQAFLPVRGRCLG